MTGTNPLGTAYTRRRFFFLAWLFFYRWSSSWKIADAFSSQYSAFTARVQRDQRVHQAMAPTPVSLQNDARRNAASILQLSSSLEGGDSSESNENDPPAVRRSKRRAMARFLKRNVVDRPSRLAIALIRKPSVLGALMMIASSTGVMMITKPNTAHASAPVMAMPKAEGRDPAMEALRQHEVKMAAKTQRELNEMAAEARRIEAEQGEAARIRYEKEYKAEKERQAAERVRAIAQLKRDLLDEGICPFTDVEGRRRMFLAERGVDLGRVPGTENYLEKQFEKSNPKKSFAFKKASNRKVLACMVADMKNRGIDQVEYFEKHQDKTLAIMDLPKARADALVEQYTSNLERYGQITVPAEGETSALERMKLEEERAKKDPASKRAAQQEAKRLNAEAKAKEREARAEAKAKEREAKAAAKAEAAAAKKAAKEEAAMQRAQAKRDKQEAKAAAAVALAAASADQSLIDSEALDATETFEGDADGVSDGDAAVAAAAEEEDPSSAVSMTASNPQTAATAVTSSSSKLPIVPAATVLVGAGGAGAGGYALYMWRQKAARDEEERQRQFRLLMEGKPGGNGGTATATAAAAAPAAAPPAAPLAEEKDRKPADGGKVAAAASSDSTKAPKKRRLGIKNVFGKKKSNYETDLRVLVDGPDARAPAFATTLAKILTFGAPGRFPAVVALPGEMPFDEFNVDEAQRILISAREDAGLTMEESAQIFANVVHCMLIDIVDLAATALKEKDDDVTVDAMDIVVDFMDLAAGLYDAVAAGVVIEPVTYGGTLGKSKLEQMYMAYASQGMAKSMEAMAKLSAGTSAEADDTESTGKEGGEEEDPVAENAAAVEGSDKDEVQEQDFNRRMQQLEEVFSINKKRAEGIMMKIVQKNIAKMLQEGGADGLGGGPGGMEGMAGMMKNMGGLMGGPGGGLGDFDPADIDPAQIKEMLLDLKRVKESGDISEADWATTKKEFKKMFGSSIDDMVKQANESESEMDDSEKELLDIMNSILGD